MNFLKRKFAVLNHFRYLKEFKKTKKLIRDFHNDSLQINDLNLWKQKFLKVSKYSQSFMSVAGGFFTTSIDILKLSGSTEKPILICVVKDDLARIKVFLDYYRRFGIHHFAILDDQSSDGTREYLMEQEGVDLFCSKEGYTTNLRQSWINRIIAYYGLNNWYLVFDSDEFLTTKFESIQSMIDSVGFEKKYRCLMVDMYPTQIPTDDFLNSFDGFDTDTYEHNPNNIWFNCIRGGMRKRVFSTDEKQVNPYLIKTPIFYANNNFIQINSHYNFPFSYDNEYIGVIRHYKFMKNDFEKYVKRAEKKNFSNGSEEYSSYVEKVKSDANISFLYEGTAIYENYESFYKINILNSTKRN